MSKKITSRAEDYSLWYNDIIQHADLAENSGVRGCMVIKPYGYAIWEKMQAELDKKFKATGHVNAYFPLFIPKSYFSKEASHVDGFAKECAVVTHYRLKNSEEGDGIVVDEDAKLEEELIVRPTSETIIWDTYRKWIQSCYTLLKPSRKCIQRISKNFIFILTKFNMVEWKVPLYRIFTDNEDI